MRSVRKKAEKDAKSSGRSADRRSEAKADGRKDRIKVLETRIQQLMKELEELKAEDHEQAEKS